MIGNRGSGKYSLFNSFLTGPVGQAGDYFKASKDAASQQNRNAFHRGRFLGEEGQIHMVNTSGVTPSDTTTSPTVIESIDYLCYQINEANLFCFTIDATDMNFHSGSKALLQALQTAFGPKFWSHFCIVFTRWGSSEES
jgi:hypothetical protein